MRQSTRIQDRETGETLSGPLSPGSVVAPGTLPAADSSHSLYAAIIVKRVDELTRAGTSVNGLMRAVDHR